MHPRWLYLCFLVLWSLWPVPVLASVEQPEACEAAIRFTARKATQPHFYISWHGQDCPSDFVQRFSGTPIRNRSEAQIIMVGSAANPLPLVSDPVTHQACLLLDVVGVDRPESDPGVLVHARLYSLGTRVDLDITVAWENGVWTVTRSEIVGLRGNEPAPSPSSVPSASPSPSASPTDGG